MSGPSAKPLFRAISGQGSTVKEPLPLPLPLDAPVRTRPRVEKRRADDFYPTGQPEAVRGLLARDGDAIRACGSVWEPACGDGALVREIRSAGIPCCASDLIERGCPDSWVADYYSCLRSRAQAIITNPPYCEINARDGHGRWLLTPCRFPAGTISPCCCLGIGLRRARMASARCSTASHSATAT